MFHSINFAFNDIEIIPCFSIVYKFIEWITNYHIRTKYKEYKENIFIKERKLKHLYIFVGYSMRTN